jgi:hypothetical protein
VLPLLLIFLLGIIDVGRLLWTTNRIEKATQMGARYAIVTNPIPAGLSNSSSKVSAVGLVAGGTTLTSGDSLDNYNMGTFTYYVGSDIATTLTCQPSGGATNCSFLGSSSKSAFDAIYAWMKNFFPEIKPTNIRVTYANSGLGYAGDPTGRDFYPVVTVTVQDFSFKPISLALFKTNFTLAPISAALTMEDGQGTVSN